MKKFLAILAFLLPALPGTSNIFAYTPPDSCLKLIWPDKYETYYHRTRTVYDNPDSVKIDSCIGSPTYGREFANRYFSCKFTTYIFDSVIKVNETKRVDDISDNYPNIKQQFKTLDSIYGPIYFIRDFVDYEWPDSAYSLSGWVFLYFENYQDVDSIEIAFNGNIDSLYHMGYNFRATIITNIKDVESNDITIHPNPATDYIEVSGGVGDVKVFDVMGSLVLTHPLTPSQEGGQYRIDVSMLPKGVYFVRVGAKMYKFVKM